MSTSIAYTQMGVQKVEDFFKIKPDNYLVTKAVKVIGRALSDTALIVAALVESTAFAALMVIASPTKIAMLSSKDRSAQAWSNAKLAASAAANAFKGIAGYSSKPVASEPKEEAEVTRAEKAADEPEKADRNIFWENRTKIAVLTGALVLGGIALYYGSGYYKAPNPLNLTNQADVISNPYSFRDYSIADRTIDYINPQELTSICHISEAPTNSVLWTGAKIVGAIVVSAVTIPPALITISYVVPTIFFE